MTLMEILKAIETYGSSFVKVTFTKEREVIGVLLNAHKWQLNDIRGFTKDHFFIERFNKKQPLIEKCDCDEAISIGKF